MKEEIRQLLLSLVHRAFWEDKLTYDEYLRILDEIDPE